MTIVLVTEEHCDDLTEKYFMSLEDAIKEWDEYYQDCEDCDLAGYLEASDSVSFDTKYRVVGIHKVTPENVKVLTSPWFHPWWTWDLEDYISDFMDGRYDWRFKIVKKAIEADTEYLLRLGHATEDIEAAMQQSSWDEHFERALGRKVLLYKTAWDPRYTSEKIYPELEALGIPLRCYHPDYNPYRGCGRGTF